jgi:hypothetical protein
MSFGDSVRQAGPDDRFSHVLLLYIGAKDGPWTVSRWAAEIDKDGLEATEERLLKQALSGEKSCGSDFQGFGFEGIEFAEHLSYFTIVLDAPGYGFSDGNGAIGPMLFVERKVNSTLPPPHAPVAPNKSFYDLQQAKVGGFPAIRCRNYLRDGYTGKPLGKDQEQGFIFNIYLHAAYAHDSKSGVVLVIDPDGTNKGPRGN